MLPINHGSSEPSCIFTIDVEDWFHILDVPSAPCLSRWNALPSRVERNFLRLLDLFSDRQVRATCFFLGWVGEQFPHLVREAVNRGHEIASHGYAHRLAFQMSSPEFYADALRSRIALEQITGKAVQGYRAAGFSAVESIPWFFQELEAAGYAYDSSVFPARRGHGGMDHFSRAPHIVEGTRLTEFPITVSNVLGQPVCFFGGGYLRLFPEWMIVHKAKKVLHRQQPVIFYIHPREIDEHHPRLNMSLARRFKCYANLGTTEQKIKRILESFSFVPFCDLLRRPSGTSEGRPYAAAG